MSKYSSNSDDDDHRGKSSRRKRRRSESSSSNDSYVKNFRRKSRKSRSRSRGRDSSNNRFKDKRKSLKDRNRTQRSRSPLRNRSRSRRRYRSVSRSRSRSRTSSNSYGRKRNYTKSKKKYKSRSRSRSRHRKSRSRSRKRSTSKLRSYRSRSRSTSPSVSKKSKNSSTDKNDRNFVNNLNHGIIQDSVADSYRISIPSDDPIIKQEQLDDINASSFTPKAFKSSKTANSGRQETNSVSSSVKVEGNYNDLCNNGLNDQHTISNKAGEFSIKRKNETVFHDSIAFEDSEQKIQNWVRKLYLLRQKYLYGYPNWDKKNS